MRGRWRREVAAARAVHHQVGVHNFLTAAWSTSPSGSATQFLEPAPKTEPIAAPAPSAETIGGKSSQIAAAAATDPTSSGATGGEPRRTSTRLATVVSPPTNPETTAAGSPSATASATAAAAADAIPLNPVETAFAESLAGRGYGMENQGFIVETMDGKILGQRNADRQFNPASVVKVVTSMVAISKLGADFRFRTRFYTDGSLDPATGILHGSLYVVGGGDPVFFVENARLIADQLNRSGIRAVEGNLVVQGRFYFNFSASREASARAFRAALGSDTWTSAQATAYQRFLIMRAADMSRTKAAESTGSSANSPAPASTLAQVAPADPEMTEQIQAAGQRATPPFIKFNGDTLTSEAANVTNLKLLAVHVSVPLVRVLKGQNDFSNNWMAGMIGEMVGGPEAVKRFLETGLGLRGEECRIATASGLGSNLVSPRMMAELLRKLIVYLAKEHIGLEELLPVAGIDAGTLERRFNDEFRGSVVAKTGTLSGVSALAGVAYTRSQGPLLFVIFNHGGSPHTFRAIQDDTIKRLISLFGGPMPIRYFTTGT